MPRTLGWILGGLLCGAGIMNLLFSFGAEYGDFATNVSKAGWDGVMDIGLTGNFMFSAVCIGLGAPLLIALNATAWKETGGY